MLANPVVVPAYADPLLWCLAFLAMWAEIRTEAALLRRSGWSNDVLGSLLLINIMTWVVFLFALDTIATGSTPPVQPTILLEAGVVVAEGVLLWSALKLRARTGAGPALSLARVFAISAVGNLVSILVSIALPMALLWWRR